MHTFFLDLASHGSAGLTMGSGLLACVSKNRVSGSEFVDHRIGDHELIPMFEKCLTEASWSPEDVTHVACVTGPGGFTSLRVAVAFANTLAWDLKIPIVGIHLSDLHKARTPSSMAGEGFLWLHSTKKTHLFIRGFGSFAEVWPEPTLISLEEFQAKILQLPSTRLKTGSTHSFVGELIPEHRAALASLAMQELPLRDINEILPAFLSMKNYDRQILKPWYGRGW